MFHTRIKQNIPRQTSELATKGSLFPCQVCRDMLVLPQMGPHSKQDKRGSSDEG